MLIPRIGISLPQNNLATSIRLPSPPITITQSNSSGTNSRMIFLCSSFLHKIHSFPAALRSSDTCLVTVYSVSFPSFVTIKNLFISHSFLLIFCQSTECLFHRFPDVYVPVYPASFTAFFQVDKILDIPFRSPDRRKFQIQHRKPC